MHTLQSASVFFTTKYLLLKSWIFSIFLLLHHLHDLSAQRPNTPISNLIFEGAGIRGIAYAGALEELNNHQLLQKVTRVGGTSSGAITALTVALNYSPLEIKALIGHTNFQSFNDGGFIFLGGIHRVNRFYGWYKGQRFSKWLGKIIQDRTGNENITFSELHNKGYKDLYITATDLSAQKMIVFSYQTTPEMSVKNAVRMSMAIPLYFQPLFLDSTHKVYYKPKPNKDLHVIVDGGIIGNFPIHLFDSTRFIDTVSANQFVYNKGTLALRIDSKEQINNDQTQKGLAALPIRNFKTYVVAFYTMIIENLNRPHLTINDWNRTISICDGDLNPRVRKLKEEQIERLFECGKEGVRTYLKNLDSKN